VRAAEKVSVDSIGSEGRFILVLRNLEQGAVVRLRPTGPLRGLLVDGLTGQTLRAEQYDGATGGLMSIDLPHEFELLLLAMQTDTSR
jgi:hypothetical protein